MSNHPVLNTGAMSAELAEIYKALHYRMVLLWLKHKQYRDLFASGHQRIELLNSTAPAFFSIVSESMAVSVMLDLSAMTDPPKSSGEKNLTITRLPTFYVDMQKRTEIQKLVRLAVKAVGDTVRPWRDKRLVHHDLELSIGNLPKLNQLPHLSEPHINTALVFIGDALNRVALDHGASAHSYPNATSQSAGSLALLGHLYTSKVRRSKWEHLGRKEFMDELPPNNL